MADYELSGCGSGEIQQAIKKMPKLIPLTRGGFALVDSRDYDRLKNHVWHWINGYAVRYSTKDALKYGLNGQSVEMSRDILPCDPRKTIDHKNRNRSDNRRSNLRVASKSQNSANSGINSRNTSGYRGVSFDKVSGKFSTQAGGKHFGKYATAEEAAKAYNAAAIKLWGAFAFQNKTNKKKGKTYGSK